MAIFIRDVETGIAEPIDDPLGISPSLQLQINSNGSSTPSKNHAGMENPPNGSPEAVVGGTPAKQGSGWMSPTVGVAGTQTEYFTSHRVMAEPEGMPEATALASSAEFLSEAGSGRWGRGLVAERDPQFTPRTVPRRSMTSPERSDVGGLAYRCQRETRNSTAYPGDDEVDGALPESITVTEKLYREGDSTPQANPTDQNSRPNPNSQGIPNVSPPTNSSIHLASPAGSPLGQRQQAPTRPALKREQTQPSPVGALNSISPAPSALGAPPNSAPPLPIVSSTSPTSPNAPGGWSTNSSISRTKSSAPRELQTRVWKARKVAPTHVLMRVFREPRECRDELDMLGLELDWPQ